MMMFYGKSAPNGQFSTGRLSWRNGVVSREILLGGLFGDRKWIFGGWVKGVIIKYWMENQKTRRNDAATNHKSSINYIHQQSALSKHFAARFTLNPERAVFPCLVLALLYKVLLARRSVGQWMRGRPGS